MTEIENKINNLLNLTQKYVVALSGGVDSSVLLHIVHSYTPNVRSVFVNHNQKDSDKLQKSAESIAKDLEIDHLSIDTQLDSDISETKMREERRNPPTMSCTCSRSPAIREITSEVRTKIARRRPARKEPPRKKATDSHYVYHSRI